MNITKKVVIAVAVLISVLFIANKAYATTGTVTAESLNLRESASKSSDVITTIKRNQEVEILSKDGEWYKVKANGNTGYVHSDYVKLNEEKIEEVEQQVQEELQKVEEQKQEQAVSENKTDTNVPENITISKQIDIYILPLVNATKISKTKQNEIVTILGSTNKWLYISAEEVNGWIRRDLVADLLNSDTTNVSNNTEVTNNEEIPNNENTANGNNNSSENTNSEQTPNNGESKVEEKTMYVNSSSIYVRKGPGTNYDYIDTLILNDSVIVIAEDGEWYKVKVDGKEGYIAKWLLSETKKETTSRGEVNRSTESNQTSTDTANVASSNEKNEEQTTTTQSSSVGQQIVDYAKQYLGCKYVYGGSGPTTFDCSGFTMYVYSKFGVSLSHSATAQSKKGTYVAKEDLRPGDLVFFKDYETMVGIGHCGIYVGDGNFIHASSGTGYCVKISTLLTGSYNTRYETARRIL